METSAKSDVERLLRDLASAFVERPAELKIASQESLTGECFFALQGAPEDEPILVGKGGSHVNALTFLVAQLGEAEGKTFTFRLITPNEPDEDSAPWERIKTQSAIAHDPAPAAAMLRRIFDALGVQATVEVSPGRGARSSLAFVFQIHPRDAEDHQRLTAGRRVVVRPFLPANGRHPERREIAIEATIEGALGTLWRAIALSQGVRYSVAVVPAA